MGSLVARSTATTAKLFSWSSSNGTRRMIPPGSSSKFPLPTLVRAYSIPSAPPRKFGSPFSPTSVVAKTTFPAALAASINALSCSASGEGSLNWTSYAITFAPSAFNREITRP